MDQPVPPPIPQQSTSSQPPRIEQTPSDGRVVYNVLADKVGGVPNLRKRDNLYQGLCIVACLAIGTVVGGMVGGWPTGAGLGALGGTIGGLLLSGMVLMVIGWVRKP